MRFVKLETNTGALEFINAEQITSISKETGCVVLTLSDGKIVRTKFLDLDHAVDFIQRASQSFSITL